MFSVPPAGRWYVREGWLKVVPRRGTDAKPRMFFLFSDMLLQAKRCSPLQLADGDKLAGQRAFPLQDCTVEKVFGHTRSQGGLLSVSVRPAGASGLLCFTGFINTDSLQKVHAAFIFFFPTENR